MRKSFKKPFANIILLQEMLSLRQQGWREVDLATKYHCDVSTISNQCHKHNVFPLTPITKRPPVKPLLKYAKWSDEEVNKGYDYKTYLEIEKKKSKQFLEN